MPRYLRSRDQGEEQRASNLELFYDLVFVFAVTQVSHVLLDDLSPDPPWSVVLGLIVHLPQSPTPRSNREVRQGHDNRVAGPRGGAGGDVFGRW